MTPHRDQPGDKTPDLSPEDKVVLDALIEVAGGEVEGEGIVLARESVNGGAMAPTAYQQLSCLAFLANSNER